MQKLLDSLGEMTSENSVSNMAVVVQKSFSAIQTVNCVGVVGRTGAGKSSILNALFRLNLICGGCIMVDEINIADVSLRDLHAHFSVVPQILFLFEGSLRDNLDPFWGSDDFKIWNALAKSHVADEVKAMGDWT